MKYFVLFSLPIVIYLLRFPLMCFLIFCVYFIDQSLRCKWDISDEPQCQGIIGKEFELLFDGCIYKVKGSSDWFFARTDDPAFIAHEPKKYTKRKIRKGEKLKITEVLVNGTLIDRSRLCGHYIKALLKTENGEAVRAYVSELFKDLSLRYNDDGDVPECIFEPYTSIIKPVG